MARPLPNAQGLEYVSSTVLKRSGAYDRGQWIGWKVGDLGMLLIDFSFSDQFCGIFEHRGPIIPLPQGFSCQGPSSNMVATDAFVHLSKNVVSIFLSHAFEEGCRETSFIKGSPQKSESS